VLNELKVLASQKDIPYQSLIKVYLAQKPPKNETALSSSAYRECENSSELLWK
jgi:hypothetical protein